MLAPNRVRAMLWLTTGLCLVAACGGQVDDAQPGGGDGGASGAGGAGFAGSAGEGGGEHELSCRSEACGGDVLGKWHLVEICGDLPEFLRQQTSLGPACENVARSVSVEKYEQTATFNAAGNIRLETNLHYRYQLEVNPGCFTSLGAQYCDQLANIWTNGSDSVMSCAPLGFDCACQWDVRAALDTTESYSVTGSTLTTSDAGPYEKMVFCAEPNELLLWGSDATRGVELGSLYVRD